jgi:hypothetical protein
MSRPVSIRRWLAFASAAAVLLTGLVILSAQAADSRLAALPDDDEGSAQVGQVTGNNPDSTVVDRLSTWAETKSKKNISPVKGGAKNK